MLDGDKTNPEGKQTFRLWNINSTLCNRARRKLRTVRTVLGPMYSPEGFLCLTPVDFCIGSLIEGDLFNMTIPVIFFLVWYGYQLNHTLDHGTVVDFFLQLLTLAFQQLSSLLFLLNFEVPVGLVVQLFMILLNILFVLILLGKW